jgi:hypothetical protein
VSGVELPQEVHTNDGTCANKVTVGSRKQCRCFDWVTILVSGVCMSHKSCGSAIVQLSRLTVYAILLRARAADSPLHPHVFVVSGSSYLENTVSKQISRGYRQRPSLTSGTYHELVQTLHRPCTTTDLPREVLRGPRRSQASCIFLGMQWVVLG